MILSTGALCRHIGTVQTTSDWLQQQIFVAFDTETTGMWAPVHRLVEIGGVRFSLAAGVTDTFSELIYPQRTIPAEVIPVHGITDDMVKDAETADKVLAKFAKFCDGSILIAHNAPFDLSFVVSELERFSMVLWPIQVLDTVGITRRALPGQKSYSLLSLATSLKLAESQEHRALADADLVRQLFVLAAPFLGKADTIDALRAVVDVMTFEEFRPRPVVLSKDQEVLSDAIINGSRVEIRYARPDSPVTVRIIQPRWLHSRRSTTYLTAYCEMAKDERTFRLDRILAMKAV